MGYGADLDGACFALHKLCFPLLWNILIIL